MSVLPLGAVESCVPSSACEICVVVRAFGSILPSCRSSFAAVILCVTLMFMYAFYYYFYL